MHATRRQFLRSLLGAGAVLSLSGAGLARGMVSLPDRANTQRDSALLDELERASFEFFWNEADPRTGLIRDRAYADGGDTRLMSSIAATGFGLTALCIAHQRGYRPQAEVLSRVRRTLQFLAKDAPHVHGFLYHYLDMRNGRRFDLSEVSPIDMAILLCGALTCRQYFQDKAIRDCASQLYEQVEWPWAMDGGSTFALSWTPEAGFSPWRWDSYSESMMLYLLAIGSPTHAISARSWQAIQRPWLEYQNHRFISSPAPLFVHQFSHAWFDFRGRRDDYTNYFENSVTAVRAHRQFCLELKPRFNSYSDDLWGITASDSCNGYVAWGGPPLQGPVDGTIVPAAAAGSLPFLLPESVAVLRRLRQEYGQQIWKRYGFVDAFNPLNGWIDGDVVGIDVGISMLMAENARTGLVWDTFMRNPEPRSAMEKCRFRPHGASHRTARA